MFLHPQIRSIYLSANDSLHFPLTKTVINKLIYQNMVHGLHRKITTNILIHHGCCGNRICTLYCYYFLQFISILFRGWKCCKQLAEILKRRKHYFHFDNIHKIQLNSKNIKINVSPGAGVHLERDYYWWGDTWWVSVRENFYEKYHKISLLTKVFTLKQSSMRIHCRWFNWYQFTCSIE